METARLIMRSYRFDVMEDGTFENRKTFAYVSPGIPDGKSLSFGLSHTFTPQRIPILKLWLNRY
jgi:hypothetical protein